MSNPSSSPSLFVVSNGGNVGSVATTSFFADFSEELSSFLPQPVKLSAVTIASVKIKTFFVILFIIYLLKIITTKSNALSLYIKIHSGAIIFIIFL